MAPRPAWPAACQCSSQRNPRASLALCLREHAVALLYPPLVAQNAYSTTPGVKAFQLSSLRYQYHRCVVRGCAHCCALACKRLSSNESRRTPPNHFSYGTRREICSPPQQVPLTGYSNSQFTHLVHPFRPSPPQPTGTGFSYGTGLDHDEVQVGARCIHRMTR